MISNLEIDTVPPHIRICVIPHKHFIFNNLWIKGEFENWGTRATKQNFEFISVALLGRIFRFF